MKRKTETDSLLKEDEASNGQRERGIKRRRREEYRERTSGRETETETRKEHQGEGERVDAFEEDRRGVRAVRVIAGRGMRERQR